MLDASLMLRLLITPVYFFPAVQDVKSLQNAISHPVVYNCTSYFHIYILFDFKTFALKSLFCCDFWKIVFFCIFSTC